MASDGKKDIKDMTPSERAAEVRLIKNEGNSLVGGIVRETDKKTGRPTKVDLKTYELTYDSFGESLEPVYYWLLDFLREDLGFFVEKTADFFAAAEASNWYGEMGVRRSNLEKRASEILGTINMVVKSIINLVYDLREFDLRFKSYEDIKSKDPAVRRSAEQTLKTIWLTEVDMKKGSAAINMMVQNLNFIALRDAFMAIEVKWGDNKEEVKKKAAEAAEKIDVTEIVKRPLKGRIAEFVDWVYISEKELKKRYHVEKAYLKSQVNALKVYTNWARPYLIGAQKLMPAESAGFGADVGQFGLSSAELATGFDVMHSYLEIFGSREVKDYGHLLDIAKVLPKEDKIFACVEIRLGYRVSQGRRDERGQYMSKGKVVVQFTPYVFNAAQIAELKKLQEQDVLQFIDVMTKDTLTAMSDDLAKYVDGKEESVKKEEKKFEFPIVKHIKWTAAQIGKFRGAFKKLGIKMPAKKQEWTIMLLKAAAGKAAEKAAFTAYDIYKKTHGMLSW